VHETEGVCLTARKGKEMKKGERKRECAHAHKPVKEKETERETERLIDRELKGEREKG